MTHKDAYSEAFLKAAGEEYDQEKIKNLRSIWWWNVRAKENGGLRLSETALTYIKEKSDLKIYKVDFPKEFTITSQVLLWLDQFIESPYFIDKKSITVLKEKSAFELYLFSGDVRKMGYSKAMAKRNSQESH